MKILYLNDELATNDGSNYHALGILNNLQQLLDEDCIRPFPSPIDGSEKSINHKTLMLQERFKRSLQLMRIIRKKILSRTRCSSIIHSLQLEGWHPTHIIARSVIFDTTAIHLAKHFHAKLIYEVNAPLYYEQCVINHLPFTTAVKKWENTILQKADLIYTVSYTSQQMLLSQYNCTKTKFIVIPNGYKKELFDHSLGERQKLRTLIRTKEHWQQKFVITFIGSLKRWHGISFLCQLAARFEANPQFHFLVIGDGSEQESILQYCCIHTNMTYKGKLNSQEMSNYLLASDLGIMPYIKMNNFYFSPLKMYDMIGAGLPFIGTNQGQIQEVATTLLTEDFLIKHFTIEDTYKQIVSLASNQALYHAMQETVSQMAPKVTWKQRTLTLLEALKVLS